MQKVTLKIIQVNETSHSSDEGSDVLHNNIRYIYIKKTQDFYWRIVLKLKQSRVKEIINITKLNNDVKSTLFHI